MSMDSYWKFFFELYEALPRQGPGDPKSTERALGFLPPLRGDQRILDVGCGSGAQTMDLARATEAQIVAIDNHAPFIETLEKRAAELDLGARITARVGDMGDLPFEDGSFDAVWSEGAIFILGFTQGIRAWRRLLKPGGHLVVSEFCWFEDHDRPAILEELLTEGCPDVGDTDARRAAVAASGYRLLEDFVLPKESWWDDYLGPLEQRLDRFEEKYAEDPDALAVAKRSREEIEAYKNHISAYGYVFFVMQREGEDGDR